MEGFFIGKQKKTMVRKVPILKATVEYVPPILTVVVRALIMCNPVVFRAFEDF